MHLQAEPHSQETELAVLAGILVNPSFLNEHTIRSELFHVEAHKTVFLALASLKEEGLAIDTITLQQELEKYGELDNIGGLAFLYTLEAQLPDLSRYGSYLAVLEERKLRRELLRAAGNLTKAVLDGGKQAPEALAEHQGVLARIATDQGWLQATGYLGEAALEVAEEYSNLEPGQFCGVPTGINDLDRLCGGMERGQLIVWAARPGMGKTALMQVIAEHQQTEGFQTKIFSLEMTDHELATRSLARRTGITSDEMKSGRTDERQREQLKSAARAIAREANIPVDDRPALKLSKVLAATRAEAALGGLRVVWVDHLGLLRPDRRYENRNIALDEMTQELASLAKELGITVNLLHQLNRGVESRTDKRPLLADLRDSGGIEQNAHRVIFIYRDEVYNPESTARGLAELIVAKNRGGPVGMVEVAFNAPRVEFRDLARDFDGSDW